ncbi:hypothetical protein EFO99_15295 [Lactiplantibacillus plantarum]|nr:hypothetical protein [Lactiplantibacillus plantarum]
MIVTVKNRMQQLIRNANFTIYLFIIPSLKSCLRNQLTSMIGEGFSYQRKRYHVNWQHSKE